MKFAMLTDLLRSSSFVQFVKNCDACISRVVRFWAGKLKWWFCVVKKTHPQIRNKELGKMQCWCSCSWLKIVDFDRIRIHIEFWFISKFTREAWPIDWLVWSSPDDTIRWSWGVSPERQRLGDAKILLPFFEFLKFVARAPTYAVKCDFCYNSDNFFHSIPNSFPVFVFFFSSPRKKKSFKISFFFFISI